ncbi:MAG: MFS transporter, partial [Methylophaga sp.]|nr:MFS transporter [Methylophaga sp.]
MSASKINLLSFSGNSRILHLTWIAFFISFVVWFNHAPLLVSIRDALGLTDQQIKTLLILNVALTIPARIVIGMLVDKYGPKIMYTMLLGISSVLCFFFAIADSFEQMALARFLLGFVGAGFVIGIRMISEWFPAKQVGLAEGIYGGWGNFGSAAAAMSLPTLALLFGGENGWRYAIALTGAIALVYS